MEQVDTKQDLSVTSIASSLPSNTTITTYHIYHTGSNKKHPKSYSIHSARDSQTTILSKKQSITLTKTITTPEGTEETIETTTPKELKGQKKLHWLDNPSYDPRSETAPYFVHLPLLAGHAPPYTLRCGGHKRAPVSCLMHGSWRWAGWRLEFSELLSSQEGVIDGRGVVSSNYGTKDGKDGTFKGYELRKRRFWGESGKAWWFEQKANEFPTLEDGREEKEKLKPEEIVELKWESPFSINTRNYGFEWRGFSFIWKGTGNVEGLKKKARPFVWCNHLKLVVLLPWTEDDGELKKGMQEVCLARYVCVMGQRKAGRLEIYQDVVDTFLGEHVLDSGAGGSNVIGELVREDRQVVDAKLSIEQQMLNEENANTQQRIRDIIVGTCLCMVQSERAKRRFVWEIIQLIGEIAGG